MHCLSTINSLNSPEGLKKKNSNGYAYGQTIKTGYVYGQIHKVLSDDYYLIKFGMSLSSPVWFKKLHVSEFKSLEGSI